MNPRTKRRIILSTAVAGSLATIVAGGLFARSFIRAQHLAESRRVGLALFAEKDYGKAIEQLAVAARDNDDLEAVLALAECRMQVPEANGKHMATAAAYFRAVLARDEANVRAMRGLLESYVSLGRLAEIPSLARRLLAAEPGDVRAREIELEVANLTGKFQDAAAKARELQTLEPANMRWRAAEIVCLERGGADAAGRLALVQQWRSDAALAGDDGLKLLEAELLRETGRADTARQILRGLATSGVSSRRSLEALLSSVESGGFDPAEREAVVEQAIAQSKAAIASAADATEIEGERLLRAGRLAEIDRRFGSAVLSEPGVMRLRFASLYLSGKNTEAIALLRDHGASVPGDDAFLAPARSLVEDAPSRTRIDRLAGPSRACPKDPLLAILLADVLLDAGEFDEAQALLVRSYESTGDGYQPVGVRAVRASLALGRVREAFRISEDLLARFGSGGDAMVALLAVEAWAAALEANYQPTTRGGVYGTDNPEALRRLWASLLGPDAAYGPAAIAPAIADVFLARGDRATAKDILEHAMADQSTPLGSLGSARVSQALRTAAGLDSALQGELLGKLGVEEDSGLALVIAERLLAQGEKDAALRALERALAKAGNADRRRIERLRRPLVTPEGVREWLGNELREDPNLETASFVLSRGEAWSSGDATLVAQAIDVMRDALGAESIRVVVAEAAATLTFHPADRARIAAAITALDAASQRSPDATGVLTTLAALFERQTPPQYERSARLLQRAAEAEPGAAAIYPQLIQALQQCGDFEGAERALEAYVRLVGDDLQSQRTVSDFKAQHGQLVEAAQIREQVVGRSREVVDTIALARIRQKMGEMRAAEALLLQLRDGLAAAKPEEQASDGRALLVERELALVYARDGRIGEARAALARAAERLDGRKVDEIRANVELAYGDAGAALSLAQSLVGGESTASSNLLLARVCLRTGDVARARAALVESLKKDPVNPEATTVAAALLLGDPDGRVMLDTNLAAAGAQRPELAATIKLLDECAAADGRLQPDEAVLARALALATEHSGSALAWRVAAHLHLIAERKDDAFRIAQRAMARLPGDASIGKLATDMAIAAHRVDEASSAALAWRKMAAAETFEVDVARATIELLQRHAEHGFQIVRPIAGEVLQRADDPAALHTLIACGVLSARMEEILPIVKTLPADRRAAVAREWIETSKALDASRAGAAIEAASAVAGESAQVRAMAAAAWTELCGEGNSEACARAEQAIAALAEADAPLVLLRADLAAARGDTDDALRRYRGVYEPALEAAESGSSRDLAAIFARIEHDAAFAEKFGSSVVPVIAMHGAAECLLRAGRDVAQAIVLAQVSAQMLPDAPDVGDTLVRALIAGNRTADAAKALASMKDGILPALAAAELAIARKDDAEARRALARAEARMQSEAIPGRALVDRLRRIEEAVGGSQAVSQAERAEEAGARAEP